MNYPPNYTGNTSGNIGTYRTGPMKGCEGHGNLPSRPYRTAATVRRRKANKAAGRARKINR